MLLFQNRAAGLLIALVLAVGLTAMGFAHRVPSQSEQMQQMVVAMGGSIHDICGDTTDGRQGDCPACRLVNLITPEPVGLRLATLIPVLVVERPPAAEKSPLRAGYMILRAPCGGLHRFDPPFRATLRGPG